LKKIGLLLLAVGLALVSAACSKSDKASEPAPLQGKFELKEVKIYSDKVTVGIPKEFEEMPKEMAELKYPGENRPQFIYSDEDGSISVAFSHTDNSIGEKDIEPLVDQMKEMYQSAASEWIDSGSVKSNGKKFGFIEFKINLVDTEVYNYIFFTDLDGKMFMGTFNTVVEKLDEWKPTAKDVLNAVKFK